MDPEPTNTALTAPVTEAPAGTPTHAPIPIIPQTIDILLDEVETTVFDAANDARRAKLAPIEEQYLKIKTQADNRYNEAILSVLKRHGLTSVPEKYGITIRDQQNNLIIPCKFTYIPDISPILPKQAPAQPTGRAKVSEDLAWPRPATRLK